jgi:micrococcal nuclease
MYDYPAAVLRVIDGDTVDLDIDLGLHVHVRTRIRLAGINAPETSTAAGKAARDWLSAHLPVGTVVEVRTTLDRTEKYGRVLGLVLLGGVDVNAAVVATGHAVVWDGTGPRPGIGRATGRRKR